MRRTHAPARDHEPLPAMLVGDGEGSSPAPGSPAIVAPHEHQTAALLPDDLCVAIEGTSAATLRLLAAALLVALVLGAYTTEWITPDPHPNLRLGNYAFVAVVCGALGWLVHRDLVRPRKEFRLVRDGIVAEVWPLAGSTPRITHVPWTEIADYTVSVDHAQASLWVESVRGYTFTLNDRPPRLSTRELIRRFVEQAERHPRAVAPEPRAQGAPLPDVTGERAPAARGCLTLAAVTLLGSIVKTILDLSYLQEMAGLAALGVIAFGVHLWWTLDDAEVAVADYDSPRLVARLRRWMRRVLGIRPS